MAKVVAPGRPRVLSGAFGSALLTALLAALVSGCASWSKPPRDLDIRQAEIVADLVQPQVQVDGFSGKGSAAGAGAAKGGGTGVIVGSLACMGAGLLFPVCISVMVPTMATVGAVSWAAVAAVNAESADEVASKRELLQAELVAGAYPSLLAVHVQNGARDRWAADPPPLNAAQASAGIAGGEPHADIVVWRIEVALTEVACEESKPGLPFALRVEGRLRLYRVGRSEVVYEKTLVVRSETKLMTAQWRADDGIAAKASLGQGVRQLAEELLDGLLGRPSPARRLPATPA